jgi:hypothetical protein
MPEAQRQRIQMILLRESGMAQPAIAEAMGVSLSTVNRAHMAYDHGGMKALKLKPSGGRKRENMTPAEEKTLLRRFAKAGGAGEMLNIHDLSRRPTKRPSGTHQQQHGLQSSDAAWLAQADAVSIPSQTRHCGSKGFLKKGDFPNSVRKARRAAAKRGRRSRKVFGDEARFGRMNG